MDESEKPLPLNPRDRPCVICGKSDYEWGQVVVGRESPREWTYFWPDGITLEDVDFGIIARRCTSCGNIQLFTD
jgi:hypothetical protein